MHVFYKNVVLELVQLQILKGKEKEAFFRTCETGTSDRDRVRFTLVTSSWFEDVHIKLDKRGIRFGKYKKYRNQKESNGVCGAVGLVLIHFDKIASTKKPGPYLKYPVNGALLNFGWDSTEGYLQQTQTFEISVCGV